MLKNGDKAPHFCLKNQDDIEVCLSDFASKNIVLYFYPKDNTPGCTTEALEFSELLGEFSKLDCIVIGVSPDSAKSHQNFIAKQNLNVLLLSDKDKNVAASYNAYGKKMMYGKEVMGIIRSTFIIKDGIIKEAFYNVRAKGHAQNILEAVKKLV